MSSDRETTRRVRSWLEEGVTTIPDRVLDAALDQLPATPQRRPIWQARRHSEMSTYAKLLAAAAVLALGVAGTALMFGGGLGPKATNAPALPAASAPSGTPGATATQAVAALLPGEFTACVPSNTEFKTGTDQRVVEGGATIEQRRGFTWKGSIDSSDPRFTGTDYYSWDGNDYTPPSLYPLTSWSEGHRIENDQGAWQGSASGVSVPDDSLKGGPMKLTGEGSYSGLTAMLYTVDGICFFNFRGFVIEVPDPPVPYTGH